MLSRRAGILLLGDLGPVPDTVADAALAVRGHRRGFCQLTWARLAAAWLSLLRPAACTRARGARFSRRGPAAHVAGPATCCYVSHVTSPAPPNPAAGRGRAPATDPGPIPDDARAPRIHRDRFRSRRHRRWRSCAGASGSAWHRGPRGAPAVLYCQTCRPDSFTPHVRIADTRILPWAGTGAHHPFGRKAGSFGRSAGARSIHVASISPARQEPRWRPICRCGTPAVGCARTQLNFVGHDPKRAIAMRSSWPVSITSSCWRVARDRPDQRPAVAPQRWLAAGRFPSAAAGPALLA